MPQPDEERDELPELLPQPDEERDELPVLFPQPDDDDFLAPKPVALRRVFPESRLEYAFMEFLRALKPAAFFPAALLENRERDWFADLTE